MPQTITARRLLTDIGEIEFPVLTLTGDGLLADISSDPRALAAEQDTLTAAFLDVHTHGAVGHDVMTATAAELSELQRFLATRGVARYLPTTVTASMDATLRALDSLATAVEKAAHGMPPGEAQPIGIHLEGPFLSHIRRGVHPAHELQPPTVELFDRFQTAARGHIKLLTLAPERNAWLAPDANAPSSSVDPLDLIRHATAQGVRISLGHTNATAAEANAAIDAGAASATHTFNAMRPLDHREPGVLGTVLDRNDLFAELICDGVHVEPPVVRLWLKAKTAARGILVTDSMSATGMPEGNYTLGGLPVVVQNGRAQLAEDLAAGKNTLAGSILTLDRGVANLQAFTGCSLGDATRMASHNPAAMLGRAELTRLVPGTPAHLNRFNAKGELIATYISGRKVEAAG